MQLNPNNSSDLHTIIGAGQIGRRLARELADAGYRVRLVRRGPQGPEIPGVEWLRGDITDPAFADEACRGAAVVYNCANPPDYHKWDGVLEPLFDAARVGATRAGARLVVLDCLYSYGRPGRTPFGEDTPMRPISHKGELRKRLAESLLGAHERGEVEVAIGRAADYFGPGTPNAIYGDRFLEALDRGRAIEGFGDIDLPRSYSYTPDVARGLAVLGTQEGTTGRVWHLPVSAQVSTRAFLETFARAHGTKVKIRMMPRWAMSAIGLFIPTLGAMVEMLYQWEIPYVVDDSDFARTFGVGATPLEQAVRETVEAWRARQRAAA